MKLLTGWWPDAPLTMRWRGWLYGLMMKDRGHDFQVASSVLIRGLENLSVGNHTYFAPGVILLCGAGIVIEDEVMLGPYTVLASGNHGRKGDSFRYAHADRSQIRIAFGSWLGAHVTVTAGVSIGRGCLIGANAVVTRDIPEGVLAGGVPAKVISSVRDTA